MELKVKVVLDIAEGNICSTSSGSDCRFVVTPDEGPSICGLFLQSLREENGFQFRCPRCDLIEIQTFHHGVQILED